MKPWQAVMLIVPTGLMMGMAAGLASKPVPNLKDENSWRQPLIGSADEIEPWRPVYEAYPEDPTPNRTAYRPALEYSAYAWPDQRDRSAELLAADYSYDYAAPGEIDLPQTHRATAELAARDAEQVVQVARAAAASDMRPAGEEIDAGAGAALPPVPPPLAANGTVPAPVEAIETESF
jgi:hypothetical protein